MFDIYSESSIFDIHPRREGQSHSSVGGGGGGGWDKVLPSTSSSHSVITANRGKFPILLCTTHTYGAVHNLCGVQLL